MRRPKIHLGCGPNIVQGWDNLDILNLPGIIHHDLRTPLPYKDKSVEKIFHEHFIEHLPKQQGYHFLQDCYRVLKPGGAMKMGWPDLTKLLDAYKSKNRQFRDFILPFLEDRQFEADWDEILSDCLFNWEHKYAYTKQHMMQLLTQIGYKEVREVQYKQTNHDIRIEVRDDPATTYIEAVR